MILFGVEVNIFVIIFLAAIIIGIIFAVIYFVTHKQNGEEGIPDLDTRESFGDFHGLLTQEDFDTKADDHMLEIYRMQWIQAEPGDEKDNYLLLYLALKQLNKEQDESENEWTQEQCEARMDEIIEQLSAETGLKLLVRDLDDTEFETYFNSDDEDDEDDDENEDYSNDSEDDEEN